MPSVRINVLASHDPRRPNIATWQYLSGPERSRVVGRMLEALPQGEDVPHPWEALAMGITQASASWRMPPVARAWRDILAPGYGGSHPQGGLERVWNPEAREAGYAAQVAYERMMMAARGALPPGSMVRIDLPAQPGRRDLPLERLLRLGQDRVVAYLTDRVVDGDLWATPVLAQIGCDHNI